MSDGPYVSLNPAPNPLQMAGQAMGVANAAQQNVLVRKTMGAKQAIGQAVANATDANGDTDYGAAMAAAARDPNAAFGMQEASADALAQRKAQFDLGMAHYGLIHQVTGALADAPKPTLKDFSNAAADLMNYDKSFTAPMMAGMMAHIQQLNPSDDPQVNRQLAAQFRDQALSAQQQIAAHYAPQYQNVGGQQVPVNMAPEAAEAPSVLTNTPSPDHLTSPATYTDASGTPHTTTVGGINAATQGGSHPIAGPAPGVVPAAQTGAVAGAQAASQLGKEVETAKGQKATLELMRGDLAHMPATGPSATMLQHIKTLGSEWGIGVNDNEVASTQGFKKFAAQIVSKAYAGMPTGSDRTLGEIVSGNPSLDISTLSNKRLIDYLEAAQDMKLAEAQAWSANKKRGVGDEHFNDFRSWFHQQMDPRFFMSQYQDAGERQQLLSSMTKSDKAKFLNGLAAAKKAGLVK